MRKESSISDFSRAYESFTQAHGCDLKECNKVKISYALAFMDYEAKGRGKIDPYQLFNNVKMICDNVETDPNTKRYALKLLKRIKYKKANS